MTLDELHAAQRDDLTLASDQRFEAFLASVPILRARRDLKANLSPAEALMLHRHHVRNS